MKKILLYAATALLLASCQESLEKRIQRESREYTEKNCPQTFSQAVDDGSEVTLWLDSITFDIPSHTLSHYYRIDRPDVLQPDLQRATLLQQLRLDTKFQVHRDHGYSFHFLYTYSQRPDSVIYEVTFTEKDYK